MRSAELLAKPAVCNSTRVVQFEFLFKQSSSDQSLSVGERQIPMMLVRSLRARRYVLRLRADGLVRVTIPRGGSATEARRFAERNREWLARQLERLSRLPKRPVDWLIGSEILFRGETVKLQAGINGETGMVRFGTEVLLPGDVTGDLRPVIEKHLWKLAAKELPPRVFGFATQRGLQVSRVTVRGQKSRWGSCSRRGTISLNWRLIQAPLFVQDYIILHELCHLRQMNHSRRFWREVERVFPDYKTAERWLREHASLLR